MTKISVLLEAAARRGTFIAILPNPNPFFNGQQAVWVFQPDPRMDILKLSSIEDVDDVIWALSEEDIESVKLVGDTFFISFTADIFGQNLADALDDMDVEDYFDVILATIIAKKLHSDDNSKLQTIALNLILNASEIRLLGL